MRKISFAGIELTSQRVRGLRGTSELPGRPNHIVQLLKYVLVCMYARKGCEKLVRMYVPGMHVMDVRNLNFVRKKLQIIHELFSQYVLDVLFSFRCSQPSFDTILSECSCAGVTPKVSRFVLIRSYFPVNKFDLAANILT